MGLFNRTKRKKVIGECLEKNYNMNREEPVYDSLISSLSSRESGSVSQGLKELADYIYNKINEGKLKKKDDEIKKLNGKVYELESMITGLNKQLSLKAGALTDTFRPSREAYEVMYAVSKGCSNNRELRLVTKLSHAELMKINDSLLGLKLIERANDEYGLTGLGGKLLGNYVRTDDVYLKELNEVVLEWSSILNSLNEGYKTSSNEYTIMRRKTALILSNLTGRVCDKNEYKYFHDLWDEVKGCLELQNKDGKHKANYEISMLNIKRIIKLLNEIKGIT